MKFNNPILRSVLLVLFSNLASSMALASGPAYLVQTSMDLKIRNGYVDDTRLRLGSAVENGPQGWLDAVDVPCFTGTEKTVAKSSARYVLEYSNGDVILTGQAILAASTLSNTKVSNYGRKLGPNEFTRMCRKDYISSIEKGGQRKVFFGVHPLDGFPLLPNQRIIANSAEEAIRVIEPVFEQALKNADHHSFTSAITDPRSGAIGLREVYYGKSDVRAMIAYVEGLQAEPNEDPRLLQPLQITTSTNPKVEWSLWERLRDRL